MNHRPTPPLPLSTHAFPASARRVDLSVAAQLCALREHTELSYLVVCEYVDRTAAV